MTNNEFVEKLYDRFVELRKICAFNGITDYDEVKEILQEVYIILLEYKNIEKYTTNGEPNMFIVFAIIKNYIYHYRKNKNKHIFISLEYLLNGLDSPDEIIIDRYEFILNEIEKIEYWFDREIIRLYITQGHTIRSLSKETKISPSTIQPIVAKFKFQCRENWKNQNR